MTYDELVSKVHEKHPNKLMEIGKEAFEALEYADKRKYEELMGKLEDICYEISQDEAETIVRKMSPKGQVWSINQIKSVLEQHDEKGYNLVNWYLVMNMMYNDYHNTAEMFGINEDVEFYYSLAYDFIHDVDGKSHKVEKYFLS